MFRLPLLTDITTLAISREGIGKTSILQKWFDAQIQVFNEPGPEIFRLLSEKNIMKHLISLLLGIAALTLAAAEENLKAFTLYDPAADGIKGKVWNLSVRNPDDMRAKFAIVDGKDGRKALEISYTGANAKAYSTYIFFNCPKNLPPPGWSRAAFRSRRRPCS